MSKIDVMSVDELFSKTGELEEVAPVFEPENLQDDPVYFAIISHLKNE